MKVQNMTSRNGNGSVRNQFLIRLDDGTEVFQSYQSVIARPAWHGERVHDSDHGGLSPEIAQAVQGLTPKPGARGRVRR